MSEIQEVQLNRELELVSKHHYIEAASRILNSSTFILRSLIRASSGSEAGADLPLSGVRVLELGQAIAGPFCGQLLGYAINLHWRC